MRTSKTWLNNNNKNKSLNNLCWNNRLRRINKFKMFRMFNLFNKKNSLFNKFNNSKLSNSQVKEKLLLWRNNQLNKLVLRHQFKNQLNNSQSSKWNNRSNNYSSSQWSRWNNNLLRKYNRQANKFNK